MQKWNIGVLHCVHCKAKFFIKVSSKNFSIVGCSCREYPLVEGILYLYKDNLRKRALKNLKRGDYKKAAITLIDQRRRLSIPITYLFFPNYFSELVESFLKKSLYQILGFKRVVSILTLFSYPKPWVAYIKNREKMPSFWTSYLAASLLKKDSQKVIDVGCGTGLILRNLFPLLFGGRIIWQPFYFLERRIMHIGIQVMGIIINEKFDPGLFFDIFDHAVEFLKIICPPFTNPVDS